MVGGLLMDNSTQKMIKDLDLDTQPTVKSLVETYSQKMITYRLKLIIDPVLDLVNMIPDYNISVDSGSKKVLVTV